MLHLALTQQRDHHSFIIMVDGHGSSDRHPRTRGRIRTAGYLTGFSRAGRALPVPFPLLHSVHILCTNTNK
jgi:hypothetical protein